MPAFDISPILEMRGIVKRFPGVIALKGVDLTVSAGEVHVLLGENGAGKSTLIKILSGVYPPDEGQIHFDGKPVSIARPHDAQLLGISTIYQELNLVPDMTVAENIFLGREPMSVRTLSIINGKRLNQHATDLLGKLNLQIDPRAIVRRLGIAQQQMVEIAKALSLKSRLIVMDEPTAVLTAHEIDQLFETIAQLKRAGVAIIYISHRLDEVKALGDRATILRDGSYVGSVKVGDTSIDQIIRMMVGRELNEKFPKTEIAIGNEALRVEHLSSQGVLHDVSLHVRRGEILGIAGLVGAGRTELARALFGAQAFHSGRIFLHGQSVQITSPADAIGKGIALIPEDRKSQGVVAQMSIKHNITLSALSRFCNFGFIAKRREHKHAQDYASAIRIASPNLDRWVRYLSGGNQQKVVIAKWLSSQADVFLFDEPTRGIDVAAKVEVYQLMNELLKRGSAIIMISSELPEVLGMSDRVLVMRGGRICGEFSRREATQERILDCALRGANDNGTSATEAQGG